jgi:glutathione S-transferase
VELYSRAISPFSARVRISILAKDLPVRIVDSPDVSSEAFGKLNPYRRVPALVLEDGTSIAESDVIVHYLEDRFPERPMLPTEPLARARVRLIARASELYLFPSVVELFKARATGQDLSSLFGVLELNLRQLASLIDPARASWHMHGTGLTLADGALAPFLFYVEMIGKASGRTLLAPHAGLERFWDGARQDRVLSMVIHEIAVAMSNT